MVEKEGGTGETFDLSKIYVWLKGIESKLNSLRREFDVLKEDFAKKNEKLGKEVKAINADLMEIKRSGGKIGEKMDLIVKELKLTAGKEEMMVLKKYIDMWNPMKFVNEDDVERIVEEKLGEKLISKE